MCPQVRKTKRRLRNEADVDRALDAVAAARNAVDRAEYGFNRAIVDAQRSGAVQREVAEATGLSLNTVWKRTRKFLEEQEAA